MFSTLRAFSELRVELKIKRESSADHRKSETPDEPENY